MNLPLRKLPLPRILVVDDQAINIQTLYQTLSDDHQVLMATSGEQALAICRASLPDLVLLDLVMPVMDGYEILRQLKTDPALRHIPVIFITANTDNASEVRGLAQGAVDFILKPINPEIVRARVKTQLTLLKQKIVIQESEQYTKAILDNAADGILTCNNEGIIESANPAAATLFGHSTEELIATDLTSLLAVTQRQNISTFFNNPNNSSVSKFEAEALHASGQLFPIEITLSHGVHGGQSLIIVILRDIAERRRIEQMKNDFISTVSHELRTPLTSINGALGLVIGGVVGSVPPAMHAMLDMAHKNSLRLSTLINDLLDMEKMLAGKLDFTFSVQPIIPVLENAIESLRAYGERLNVSFQLQDHPSNALVNIDSNRLHQVMANLLSNAAKYSPQNAQVEIAVTEHDDRVRIAVTDHGTGIPLKFRDQVFQKFSQADASNNRTKGGTGLGLAIAREMITRMNGSIGFTTETDVGSCFYVELPCIPVAAETQKNEST